MMRDTNNIRGAMQRAASMGRGGDNQVAHVGKGEVLIPPEVIDTNPQVMAPLIKAFQKAGMDWRRYLVGSDRNSKNPQTGAREFYGAGGVAGKDISREVDRQKAERDQSRDRSDPTGDFRPEYRESPSFERALDIVDPGGSQRQSGRRLGGVVGAIGGGLTAGIPGAYAGYKAGQSIGGMIGGAAGGAYGGRSGGPTGAEGDPSRDRDRGVQTELTGLAGGTPQPPPKVPVPAYLELDPGMTPLQVRSQIATYGLNSDDSRYQTQETQDYYKSLLYSDLVNAGSLDVLTPVEQQYLREVLGLDYSNYDQLLALLSPGRTSGLPRRNPAINVPGMRMGGI